MITQAELKEVLEYNPDTGVFTWKKRGKGRTVGNVAGSKECKGYIIIEVKQKKYKAHRLAYLYTTGNFPKNSIDHINHIKDDNRWTNLRDATHSQNMSNQAKRKTNTSGYKGVSWNKRCKKWHAKIHHMNKYIHLGLYTTPEEAAEAYKKAALELYGKFAETQQ